MTLAHRHTVSAKEKRSNQLQGCISHYPLILDLDNAHCSARKKLTGPLISYVLAHLRFFPLMTEAPSLPYKVAFVVKTTLLQNVNYVL